MRQVNDIEIDDAQRQGAVVEEVGRKALESLARLWSGETKTEVGYHVNNRKLDLVGAQVADRSGSTLSEQDGNGEVRTLPTVGDGHPKADESTSSSGDRTFNLATVTSLDAILDALIAVPEWVSADERRQMVAKLDVLLQQDPEQPDQLHPTDDAHVCLPLLRYSTLLTALAKIIAWRPNKDDLKPDDAEREGDPAEGIPNSTLPSSSDALERQLVSLQSEASAKLDRCAGRMLADLRLLDQDARGDLHCYVVYQLICALDAIESFSKDSGLLEDSVTTRAALWESQKARLERLIAGHGLSTLDAGGSIELLFGCAIAARMKVNKYVDATLRCVVSDGRIPVVWHQGRVLAQDEGENLAVIELSFPAMEAARVLAETILASLEDKLTTPLIENRGAITKLLFDILDGAHADHIEDTQGGVSGWPGDRIYKDHVVEAWPTASALAYSVALAKIIDRVKRSRILAELKAIESWGKDWPRWLSWDKYIQNEPEQDAKILEFIDLAVVKPRRDLDSSIKTKAVVVLLFGPPGTTKTTIARSVANGLGWPIVMLSPGNFIEDGLERVERRATWVFDRLQQLSRTVVILDECDELFRKRDPDQTVDSERQVSAFMTASMLPKLQDLHDRSKIVVFICTNFLTSIDNAIKRPGRVDHLIAVSPPDELQRERTVRAETGIEPEDLERIGEPVLNAAVRQLAVETLGLIRGELVNVARELGKALVASSDLNEEGARLMSSDIAKPATQPKRMTIETKSEDYKQFVDDKQAISEPHRIHP